MAKGSSWQTKDIIELVEISAALLIKFSESYVLQPLVSDLPNEATEL